MPVTAWPPAWIMTRTDPDSGEPRPDWPPPGYSNMEVDRDTLLDDGPRATWRNFGFTKSNRTQAENQAFAAARCDEGHTIPVARRFVLTHPNAPGIRYPFAACGTDHADTGGPQLLVLWNAPSYTL